MTKSWGIILLAIFLLVYAFLALTNLEIVYVNVIQGVLAAAAGVCLLLGK
jgi:uncharacterized integral membrane protein